MGPGQDGSAGCIFEGILGPGLILFLSAGCLLSVSSLYHHHTLLAEVHKLKPLAELNPSSHNLSLLGI